jgi:hypothetical protein
MKLVTRLYAAVTSRTPAAVLSAAAFVLALGVMLANAKMYYD